MLVCPVGSTAQGEIDATNSQSIDSSRPFLTLFFPTFLFAVAAAAPKMMESVDMVAVNDFIATQNANLIATSSTDFGGSFYPVAGLTLLGALILYLSPPLED